MNKIKVTLTLILTFIIVIGTTCLAETGIVKAERGLVLREEASTDANPLTTVPDNDKVEIIEKDGEWYKAKYGIYEGYLYAEFVDTQEEIPEQEPEVQEENTTKTVENEEQTKTTYSKDIVTATQIKAYIIPAITSKVVLNIEQEKTIAVNYELNNWLNITYEGKEYWIRKYYISNKIEENEVNNNEDKNEENINTTKPEEQRTPTVIDNKKGYINVNSAANIRQKADTSAEVITTLLRNTGVTIIEEEGEFYKIQYQDITGYVAKSLVSDNPVETTSRSNSHERQLVTEKKEEQNKEKNNISLQASTEGEKIANFAKQYEGYEYVYGGTTPAGFDCTGFAYYVYNSCGYSLSRSCSAQAKAGKEVGRESRDELQVGDLLLFANGDNGSIGHVGIYIGNSYFIHAKNSNSGVVIDHLTNNPYYNQYYYSGRRIVN